MKLLTFANQPWWTEDPRHLEGHSKAHEFVLSRYEVVSNSIGSFELKSLDLLKIGRRSI